MSINIQTLPSDIITCSIFYFFDLPTLANFSQIDKKAYSLALPIITAYMEQKSLTRNGILTLIDKSKSKSESQNRKIALTFKTNRLNIFLKSINKKNFEFLETSSPISTLNVQNQALLKVPAAIFEFPRLVVLNLSKNGLSKLPDDFLTLKLLKRLELHTNLFKEIPAVLHRLPQIEFVGLLYNRITTISAQIDFKIFKVECQKDDEGNTINPVQIEETPDFPS